MHINTLLAIYTMCNLVVKVRWQLSLVVVTVDHLLTDIPKDIYDTKDTSTVQTETMWCRELA